MTHELPQLGPDVFLADGGIETDLIFNKGAELPEFAAFTLLSTEDGTRLLDGYFREYLAVAAEAGTGLVLESATWRANPDWAAKLGYDADGLARANRQAVELLLRLRDEQPTGRPVVVSGCVGPRSDGYRPEQLMDTDAATEYHSTQIRQLRGADLVTAITMGYPEEAIGVARAARDAGLPAVISFTVETDGTLPVGMPLAEAVARVDEATDGYPAYYMLNCAHPDHFAAVLDPQAAWTHRIRGLRSNASRLSHAELDEAPTLDAGDPAGFGPLHRGLRDALPWLTVFGGCCGTDARHVRSLARSL
ncbi:homocysteine S-methyltransferase family protein [Dactylosporangium sp. AC04546]|uniref:homocysteine S-methyltransferase family protein n=1 Tax=Dactylosporangium sp. AC04546 TaxID=2862460 RepID=UPI001EDD705E|nr:homocysteine S-methyltransferase family protein [Dactylosporangium sp. AC04546]WVK82466.1 homocysteine S-methyltransferase family protein [Dactylosporangium sp. AC04546]